MIVEGLLPCPFCGGRAEVKEGVHTQYVMCLSCEVMGANLKDKAELIAAWNRRPALASAEGKDGFDFLSHLARQRAFSEKTFGPGTRTRGVTDHIRKELREIEADPSDISEWIDIVILGLDGAWRAGFQPQEIIDALVSKQDKNEAREWPDWRTAPPDRAIEHVRGRTEHSEVMKTIMGESYDELD